MALGAGALHGGISYFRSHWVDAEHNREHAKTRLAIPVLTVAGSASARHRACSVDRAPCPAFAVW